MLGTGAGTGSAGLLGTGAGVAEEDGVGPEMVVAEVVYLTQQSVTNWSRIQGNWRLRVTGDRDAADRAVGSGAT